jgi:hypothetical protein
MPAISFACNFCSDGLISPLESGIVKFWFKYRNILLLAPKLLSALPVVEKIGAVA